MSEIILIKTDILYDTENVRILGSYNEPWFVAKDICAKLGLTNVGMALKKIPSKWKKITKIPTTSGDQLSNIISEPALYLLIMRSAKPEAIVFREWICEEVLPSLRKKGIYELEEKYKKENLKLESEIIRLKRSIKKTQVKFSERHKFPAEECVYILENPDYQMQKYKIGRTDDINTRLKSDRTMVPKIKVRYILYTRESKSFEDNIKRRCANTLDVPAHEWVNDSLENLIKIYRDINVTLDYGGVEEEELWRYNLEQPENKNLPIIVPPIRNPPKEKRFVQVIYPNQENKQDSKQEGKQETTMPYEMRLATILPTMLIRYDYTSKNKIAPQGQRWCNGFCQDYRLLTQFIKISSSYMTICNVCENLVEIANVKILNGELTSEQIRKNPQLLRIEPGYQICRKCNKVLPECEFPEGRRQCKDCRNKTRSSFGDKFEENIDKEIATLKMLEEPDLKDKLSKYTKIELHRLAQTLQLGRKASDNKNKMVEKLYTYFVGLLPVKSTEFTFDSDVEIIDD